MQTRKKCRLVEMVQEPEDQSRGVYITLVTLLDFCQWHQVH